MSFRVIFVAVGTVLALAIALMLPARAETLTRESLCLMIESAAQTNNLPAGFLTRVIWRESRFDPNAIGPVTRSGARAEGIAQFMPPTAAERALENPFNPVEALPKAAEFLRELRNSFGNLGLAAAAYNAGPQRVRDWLVGVRTLPGQTRSYVYAITGRSADEWAQAGAVKPVDDPGCTATMASLQVPPSVFAYELERRVTAAIGKAWGVTLAAGFSRQHVLASYAHAMEQLSSLIGPHDPVLTRALFRSRGTGPFYEARIGVDTRGEANDLCARIRKAGGACAVLRNGTGRSTVEEPTAEVRK